MTLDEIFFSQRVCIWDWMNQTEKPLWDIEVNPKYGFQVGIYCINV